jgi:hypothetical protein
MGFSAAGYAFDGALADLRSALAVIKRARRGVSFRVVA